MSQHSQIENRPHGIIYAITAALLLGASTPFAKLLVGELHPVLLASLLYLGSGIGLTIWLMLARLFRDPAAREAPIGRSEWPWLAAAIACGGVAGPLFMMMGLSLTPASSASLLLNLEGVFTALLAWFVFRENFDRRIALGIFAIACGGIILSWSGRPNAGPPWGPLAIVAACFCWAMDNNLTRKVSGGDPVTIAATKGWAAGMVNLLIALSIHVPVPPSMAVAAAAVIGFLGYGVSLSLFVLGLRHLGTARTGAYFSLAPFVGSIISLVVLGESLTISLVMAGILMAIGVWLHLTERHEHEHYHEPIEHEHLHYHDEHHQHEHLPTDPPGEPHCHPHRHEALRHTHVHYPDLHHRHTH
jgi:drug/metabolite transporter (DMT)-like permease